MHKLIIKNMSGEVARLSNYKVIRTDSVNGERSIEVSITHTKKNNHSFPLVQHEGIFIYRNDEYRIKYLERKIFGNKTILRATAVANIFDDLNNMRNYETVSKTLRLEPMLDFSLKGTGYSHRVLEEGLPLSTIVENFGMDSSKNLFFDTLSRFEAEFDYSGKEIVIAKEIGRVLNKQFRYRFNVKDPTVSVETTDFKTVIRGYGKRDEETGELLAYAEYRSPLADVYGEKHADQIEDERFTDSNSLFDYIRRELNDAIPLSITLNGVHLNEMGLTDIRKGDYVWCILKPFNVDVQVRVVEIVDTEDEKIAPEFTFGSIKRKATDVMNRFRVTDKTLKTIVDSRTGQIKNTAIDTSNISFNLSNAKGNLSFERIEGLEIPNYSRANALNDGLMASEDFVKLRTLNIDSNGNISIPLADAFSAGLMSPDLFIKLNAIQTDESGNIVVDLSAILTRLDDFERRIKELEGGGGNA